MNLVAQPVHADSEKGARRPRQLAHGDISCAPMSNEEGHGKTQLALSPIRGEETKVARSLGVSSVAVRQVNADVLPRVAELVTHAAASSSLGNRSAPALDSAPITSPAVVVSLAPRSSPTLCHGDPVFVLHGRRDRSLDGIEQLFTWTNGRREAGCWARGG